MEVKKYPYSTVYLFTVIVFSPMRKHHISARAASLRNPGLQHFQVCLFLMSNEGLVMARGV